jgi:hypothetical protein
MTSDLQRIIRNASESQPVYTEKKQSHSAIWSVISLLRRGFGVIVLSKKAGNLCQKLRPIVQNTGGGKEFIRNLLQVNYVKRSSFEFLTHLEFSKLDLQIWKTLCKSLREFAIFLSAVAIFQREESSFQIFLTSCFNFLTSCSVLSVFIGGLFLLANCNAQNRTEQEVRNL